MSENVINPDIPRPASEPPTHTVEIVQSLCVKVNVDLNISAHAYSPPCASVTNEHPPVKNDGVTSDMTQVCDNAELTIAIPHNSEFKLEMINVQEHEQDISEQSSQSSSLHQADDILVPLQVCKCLVSFTWGAGWGEGVNIPTLS